MGIRVKKGQLILPATRIVITGTRDLGYAQRGKLFQCLDRYRGLYPGSLWITGACLGVDELAASILHSGGEMVYTVVPADKDHIDPRYKHRCDLYEIMPKSCGATKSERYMARNQRMIDRAVCKDDDLYPPELVEDYEKRTVLCLAFPDEPETNRSGTWATVRRARRTGIKRIKITRVD